MPSRFFRGFPQRKACAKIFIFPLFTEIYARWGQTLVKKVFFAPLWKSFPLFSHTFSPSFPMTFQGSHHRKTPSFRELAEFCTASPPPKTTTAKFLYHSFLFLRPCGSPGAYAPQKKEIERSFYENHF
jgi:hypothetical protein